MVRFYYTPQAMKDADAAASEKFRVPSLILMENAGRGASEIILEKCPEAGSFLVLCGSGNNGGDGLCAARHLALAGRDVAVLATVPLERMSPDARVMAEAFASNGSLSVSSELSDDDIESFVWSSDVVVDALLGTGSNGSPRGEVMRLIDLCCSGPFVVSLDIPSGIDALTGAVPGSAVDADLTVTFLAEKSGLAIAPGALKTGEIIVCGIGVTQDAIETDPHMTGWSDDDIATLVPSIDPTIHKGSRGGLMIIGGSDKYRGAPVLAARAALRSGCGFVFLAVPDVAAQSAAAELPEAIILSIPTDENGQLRHSSLEEVVSPWNCKIDAAVLGPGLGRSASAEVIVKHAAGYLRNINKPLVLDGDALFHLSFMHGLERSDRLIITPHAQEAARLLGRTASEVDADRLAAVTDLARRYGRTVLKGPHTLISDGEDTRVILAGGPQLAVPGSGDVLAGVIGALLARGMDLTDAATLAALAHGTAGDRSGRMFGLMAREIADGISDVLSFAG